MSAHLNRDSLWELASAPSLPAEMQSHLATCGDCQIQLAQVKQAQSLLQFRQAAPPPPLNPIAARRIGAVLKEAAEEQLQPKGWFGFSLRGFGWAVAGVAAIVLAILMWNQAQTSPAPMPIVKHEAPAPTPAPQLAEKDPVAPPAPVPQERPKLLAKVTGAKKAKSQDGKLLKTQTVAEGSQVATETGGALWLALPDGSRAGLTGNTELKIDKLEEKALSFTLEKGNVMMVARHLPERMMTVKAGEIEVRDIGTRFLVSRDVNRVLVAVEEGVVEINAPGTKMILKAGRSVEWREGQLREQVWAPAPPREAKGQIASPPTPAIEAFVGDAGAAAAVAVAAPAPEFQNPDDEWAAPPNLPKTAIAAAPVHVPSPGAPPHPAPVEDEPPVYEAPAPAEDEEASVLSLAGLELRLRKVTKAVQAPFAAVGSTIRETRSREIGRLADEGNCEEALRRADAWLLDKPSVSVAEPRWRRAVMVNQMRCYTRLNRTEDASRIKSKLE
jgi:hypothetical protein